MQNLRKRERLPERISSLKHKESAIELSSLLGDEIVLRGNSGIYVA